MFVSLMWIFFILVASFFIVASLGCGLLFINYRDFHFHSRMVGAIMWVGALTALWCTRFLMKNIFSLH